MLTKATAVSSSRQGFLPAVEWETNPRHHRKSVGTTEGKAPPLYSVQKSNRGGGGDAGNSERKFVESLYGEKELNRDNTGGKECQV